MTKIYVLTHKKIDIPIENIYEALHVGKAISQDLGYPGDNTGDNISNLNPFFGELTGIYWIWQNDLESDFIGVCHYRRFFLNQHEEILTEKEFELLLSNYDCITSDQSSTGATNYECYGKTHPIRDLDIVGESLKKLYPEYSTSYDNYMSDNKSCYSNLAVMPRQMFSDYCSWLFSILFDASEKINVDDYDLYQRRVYGFLSEMLLDVYVRHNNFNVYRCPVGTFGDKAETKELIAAVDTLIKANNFKEARSLCENIVNARPDITLPMSDSRHRIPIVEHITCILDLESDVGITGFISYSNDINELIEHYRHIHRILERSASEADILYLKNSNYSPLAALVMISNDIARGIRQENINTDCADETLKKVFSTEDYNIYKNLVQNNR